MLPSRWAAATALALLASTAVATGGGGRPLPPRPPPPSPRPRVDTLDEASRITATLPKGNELAQSSFVGPAQHAGARPDGESLVEQRERALIGQILELNRQLEQQRRRRVALMERWAIAQQAPRVIVVANRLPLRITRNADGELEYSLSPGGMVSALLGVKHMRMLWVGWVAVTDTTAAERLAIRRTLWRRGCVPLFLEPNEAALYYNGFCNDVLWPLFHYVVTRTPGMYDHGNEREQWAAYRRVNKAFADTVASVARDGDLVWVHDYHLMLLPAMLRQRCPRMKVGWFLHTPWPSLEVFRTLPFRRELIQGLLAADLIGFHIYEYARHFLHACTHLMGSEVGFEARHLNWDRPEPGGGVERHSVRVDAFPIGIDPQRFRRALETPAVQARIDELRKEFQGRQLLLGVDRMDYIKGIPHKLLAVERLLELHPELVGKVVLLQIAVPTRTEVPEYQKLRASAHELVGRINGRFGSPGYVPVVYLDKAIPFEEMCALYATANACVVASLRDGMNLVSYEYVMCHPRGSAKGVLVLSEFAGAAQALGAGCVRVNPYDIEQLARGLYDAIAMGDEQRAELHEYAHSYVSKYTAQAWAHGFVAQLQRDAEPTGVLAKHAQPLELAKISRAFQRAKRRLIVVGVGGALFAGGLPPGQIFSEKQRRLLQRLAAEPSNCLVLVSSRSRARMQELLDQVEQTDEGELLPGSVNALAESGVYGRGASSSQFEATLQAAQDGSWLAPALEVFRYFEERTPESQVFVRERSIRWEYGASERKLAEQHASNMVEALEKVLQAAPVELLWEGGLVEVRPFGSSCGLGLLHVLARERGAEAEAEADAAEAELGAAGGGAEREAEPEVDSADATAGEVSADAATEGAEEQAEAQLRADEGGGGVSLAQPRLASALPANCADTSAGLGSESGTVEEAAAMAAAAEAAGGEGGGEGVHEGGVQAAPPRQQQQQRWRAQSQPQQRRAQRRQQQQLLPFDFVLCLGNFSSRDEDIFLKLHDAEQPPPERADADRRAREAAGHGGEAGAAGHLGDGSFELSAAERVERARLLFKSHLRLDEELIQPRAMGIASAWGSEESSAEETPPGGGGGVVGSDGGSAQPSGDWRRAAENTHRIRNGHDEATEDAEGRLPSEESASHAEATEDADAEATEDAEGRLRLDVAAGGAFTVTLGNHSTQARFFVESQHRAEALLETLAICGGAKREPAPGPHGLPRRLWGGTPDGSGRVRPRARARSAVLPPPPIEYLPNALEPEALAEIEGRLANCFTPAFLLDFDGTLTPIIADPSAVRLSPGVASLLQRLADRHPTAIVSGRAVEKLQAWVPVRGLYYAGSHGFEIIGPNMSALNYTVASTLLPELRQAHQAVYERVSHMPGVLMEDNKYVISVHLRNVSEHHVQTVSELVDAVLEENPLLQRAEGNQVIEVRPQVGWHKGRAMEWLLKSICEELGLPSNASSRSATCFPIYIGDDVSDEDAFRELKAGRGVGIVVRPEAPARGTTAASMWLSDPTEVALFLSRFLPSEEIPPINALPPAQTPVPPPHSHPPPPPAPAPTLTSAPSTPQAGAEPEAESKAEQSVSATPSASLPAGQKSSKIFLSLLWKKKT